MLKFAAYASRHAGHYVDPDLRIILEKWIRTINYVLSTSYVNGEKKIPEVNSQILANRYNKFDFHFDVFRSRRIGLSEVGRP